MQDSSPTSVTETLASLRRELNRDLAKYRQARADADREAEELIVSIALVTNTLQSQQILQDLAQLIQQRAHTQIARVVTKCLVAVFEKPYELRIIFEQRAGSTVARLVYYEGEYEIIPKMTSGGVLDVASMALRLIVLVLSNPQTDKVLVLDEPFRMLDATNMPRVAQLLLTLSLEMGVQFVICTHSESLQIGKIVRL